MAGVALGAGAGTRLAPLTLERPKVLCPVAGRPLIDHALDRLTGRVGGLAVNHHHTQPTLAAHLRRRGDVHVSEERGAALGTAGALAKLRPWIDGRAVVVVNGDTWCPGGVDDLLDGWDGEAIRVLVGGAEDFGPRSLIAGALMPWADVAALAVEPSGLWEVSWRQAVADGRIETVGHLGPFVDCADAADYLAANLAAAGGSAVSPEARVDGHVSESVVWAGAEVRTGESLWRAIRTPRRTVLVRRRLPEARV